MKLHLLFVLYLQGWVAGWVVGKLESNAKLNSKVKVEVEVAVELGKSHKQAGAVLGQAQLKLGLDFTSINLH